MVTDIVKTLEQFTDLVKTSCKQGVLVYNCETEVVRGDNTIIVEFLQHTRSTLSFEVVVSSTTCKKTLLLASLVQTVVEPQYRWVSSSRTRREGKCYGIVMLFELPTVAQPPNFEPLLVFPTVLDTNLSIGYCWKPLPDFTTNGSTTTTTVAQDCCDKLVLQPKLLVTFTDKDLVKNVLTVGAPQGFSVKDNLGATVVPSKVQALGGGLFRVDFSNVTPLLGVWSILEPGG